MTMDAVLRPIRGMSPFCGGRKGDGSTCRNPAGKGTNHVGVGYCRLHGGATPTHVTAAQVAMARQTAQLYAVPREVHPFDGLIEEYHRTAGLVDSYEAMCARLSAEEIVESVISIEETETTEASDGGESMTPPERKVKRGAAVNIWVKLLNEERERFARLGVDLMKLNLDERRLSLEQSHVAVIVQILLSPELALDDEQRRAAARLLRAHERPAIEGQAVA